MATYTCTAGVCSGACAAGYTDCNANKLSDGCETATGTDPSNCGGCGTVCSSNNMATGTCGSGVCNGTCVSGYSDCNANKQSDGCETNTGTDVNNCGGCNTVCSLNNMATDTCTSGVCNGSCTSPFLDCNNNKQSDGCEVNPTTSAANCGGCGIACSSNNMATVTCGASTCNGTCKTGYADCNGNKLSDGCEINTNTDKNNCGNCGNPCASGQSCVNGTCQTCNTTVLLLSDGNAMDATISAALTAAGLVPTVVASGVVNYTGTPAASSFGAVIVAVGNAYASDMPAGGQTAIVSAFNAGTGTVFTEWSAYEATQGRFVTLKPLILTTYSGGTGTVAETYTLTSAGHPIWTGLPTTFTTTIGISSPTGVIVNGGTRIATGLVSGTTSVNGVVVKDVVGSSGRTVQIDQSTNYTAGWTADANLMKMLTNSAKWAAKCM
jgi:hypothetical protein